MASYVKFELDDGTIVYVESTDTPRGSSGLIPPGRAAEQAADQSAISFDKSVQTIRKMATSLMQNLQTGFEEQPEEVGINFGLKASSDLSGLVVARGGMEANFNVSLRWRQKDEEDKKGGNEKEARKSARKTGEEQA